MSGTTLATFATVLGLLVLYQAPLPAVVVGALLGTAVRRALDRRAPNPL